MKERNFMIVRGIYLALNQLIYNKLKFDMMIEQDEPQSEINEIIEQKANRNEQGH